ncbi:hypothetical protein ACFQY5_22880 [Paeniroseomonas aquatica]|uniref:hypothetical protein n=1 Tax=Paeniroseomonas aquatica TaxID=373043 RepID=UPI003623EAF7
MTPKLSRLPTATAEAAQVRRRSLGAMIAHKRRCREAGQPDAEAVNRMIHAFHARGGAITQCPRPM